MRLQREPSDAEKGVEFEKRRNAGISIARTLFVNFYDLREKPNGWELISDCPRLPTNLEAIGQVEHAGQIRAIRLRRLRTGWSS